MKAPHVWLAPSLSAVRIGVTMCGLCRAVARRSNLEGACPAAREPKVEVELCWDCQKMTTHEDGKCRACFFREMGLDARIDEGLGYV